MLLGYIDIISLKFHRNSRKVKSKSNKRSCHDGKIKPSGCLSRLDQNGDHALSKEEIPKRLRSRFDQVDSDHSGLLSYEEVRQSQAQ